MLRVGLSLFVATTVSATALAQSSSSDPRVADARARFERAEAHYEAGDYALALEGYERAYEILREVGHPNAPLVIYNVARSNERLGRVRVALEQFERFLVDAPSDTPYRDDATRHAADLRRRLELERADAPSGGGPSVAGVVVLAVGGAAAVAGAILAGVAWSESEAARAGCEGTRCPPQARAGLEGAQELALAADVLLFGGLAVAATGALLLILLDGDGGAEASVACGPTGCGASIRGRF